MGRGDVLVIGAGVIGMPRLGGGWGGVGAIPNRRQPARISAWSRRSLEVFTALSRVFPLGHGHRRLAGGWPPQRRRAEWASLTPGARPCLSAELPAGYWHGYRFVLPAIDMAVYLAYLLGRLERAGGTLQQQTVAALEEDARDLSFLIPHGQTLILGGTAEPDNHHCEPDPATAEAILARCAGLDPRVAGASVLGHRVGFRPVRPEVRVGTEPGCRGRLWHNYGHGGAGVTLSWGCAETLTAGVVRLLQTGTPVDR